jgi:hypothetical protein
MYVFVWICMKECHKSRRKHTDRLNSFDVYTRKSSGAEVLVHWSTASQIMNRYLWELVFFNTFHFQIYAKYFDQMRYWSTALILRIWRSYSLTRKVSGERYFLLNL